MIEDPLQCCRYYNGEKENPFEDKDQNNAMLWFYERCWMEQRNLALDNDNYRFLFDMVKEYMYYGLMMFADHDKAPVTLKSLLFNRYCHWNYADVDEFKYWYNNTYKAEAIR